MPSSFEIWLAFCNRKERMSKRLRDPKSDYEGYENAGELGVKKQKGTAGHPIEINTEDTSIYWSDEEPNSDGVWIEDSNEIEEIEDSGQDDDADSAED